MASLYLILSAEVTEALDKLAESEGTDRSQIADSILRSALGLGESSEEAAWNPPADYHSLELSDPALKVYFWINRNRASCFSRAVLWAHLRNCSYYQRSEDLDAPCAELATKGFIFPRPMDDRWLGLGRIPSPIWDVPAYAKNGVAKLSGSGQVKRDGASKKKKESEYEELRAFQKEVDRKSRAAKTAREAKEAKAS